MAGENFAAKIKQQGAMRSTYGDTAFRGGSKQLAPETKLVKNTGIVAGFKDKTSDIAAQTFDIGKSVVKATPQFVVNRAKDIYDKASAANYGMNPGIARARQEVSSIKQRQLDQIQRQTVDAYRAGRISKENYTKTLQSISRGYQDLSKKNQENAYLADPKRINLGIAETATNILALGSFSLIKQGAKETVKLSRPQKLVLDASKAVEDAVKKVPAMGPLIERNAVNLVRKESQKIAGETTSQYLKREGSHVASALLIKQPIFYQQNIGDAVQIYTDIINGNYPDAVKRAAWVSTQLLKGGPLGAAGSVFKGAYNKAGKLAYGTGSYIDELGRITNGDSQSYARYLQSLDGDELKRAEKTLRIAQEVGLRVTKNPRSAAEATADAWLAQGLDLAQMGPKEGVKLLDDWADAQDYFTRMGRAGKIQSIKPEELNKYVLVRWDVNAKNTLAEQFENAGDDVQEIVNIARQWELLPGSAANNKALSKTINNIIQTELNVISDIPAQTRIANRIREISAVSVMPKGIDSATKKYLAKRGYAIAQPYNPDGKRKLTPKVTLEETRKLVTNAVEGSDDLFEKGELPVPILSSIAGLFEKSGLSPQATSSLAHRQLAAQVAEKLSGTEVARVIGMTKGINKDAAGKVILGKLQQYVDELKPNKVLNVAVLGKAPGPAVVDIRQLSPAEIKEALGLSTLKEGFAVHRAVVKGYTDTALEYRGLGDKIVDGLYQYNPLQPYYSRIQSALRYTYNPFFRFQEKVETSLLSRAQARTVLWGKSRAELDEVVSTLDNSGLFKSGLSGEAAQDLIIGRVTATITKGQKRNIAGLASKMADSYGISVEDLVRDHGDEVGDALRVVVQYPNKGILNSSLARTLNIAFFPMRYNLKVTKLAAEIISKEPPSVQLAIINSIFDTKNWLQSDEGIKWRSEHADALQVFEWATPVGSISYFMKLFSGDARLADMGSIGGLPLGVITQMLDSQGIIKLNNPYVNPETGDVLPKYIPETAKARASVALTDMLGSLFTYPGRILGLPGKGQSLNNLSQNLTGAEGVDFNRVEQDANLTDLQRNYIRVLKGDHSDEALDALYTSPRADGYQGYTLPPLNLPGLERKPLVERRLDLPTKAELKAAKSAKAKQKKVKPRPQPIPQR